MKNLVIIIFFLIFSCTKDSNNSTGPCTENCAIPAWDNDGDGVLDNYSDYQNNGSITIAVFLNEENSATGGDMLAVFEDEIQIGGINALFSDAPSEEYTESVAGSVEQVVVTPP